MTENNLAEGNVLFLNEREHWVEADWLVKWRKKFHKKNLKRSEYAHVMLNLPDGGAAELSQALGEAEPLLQPLTLLPLLLLTTLGNHHLLLVHNEERHLLVRGPSEFMDCFTLGKKAGRQEGRGAG